MAAGRDRLSGSDGGGGSGSLKGLGFGIEIGAGSTLELCFELGLEEAELLCVSPFTCKSSATARNELSSSWATFTSP